MPIRTVFRLPGPWVFVGKSRTERRLEHELDLREKDREIARRASLSTDQRDREDTVTVFAWLAFIALVVLGFAWWAGPGWFVVALVLVGLFAWSLYRSGQKHKGRSS